MTAAGVQPRRVEDGSGGKRGSGDKGGFFSLFIFPAGRIQDLQIKKGPFKIFCFIIKHDNLFFFSLLQVARRDLNPKFFEFASRSRDSFFGSGDTVVTSHKYLVHAVLYRMCVGLVGCCVAPGSSDHQDPLLGQGRAHLLSLHT
jgi:hypothetical protein